MFRGLLDVLRESSADDLLLRAGSNLQTTDGRLWSGPPPKLKLVTGNERGECNKCLKVIDGECSCLVTILNDEVFIALEVSANH